MTYGGALSFLRRRYTRDLAGVEVAVMGFPYDASVTYRPGCRLGPRAIRAASVQLAELKAFPWGFDLLEALAVVDRGDAMIDPHHPATVAPAIEAAAAEVIASGAKLLSLGGTISSPGRCSGRMRRGTGRWLWCISTPTATSGRTTRADRPRHDDGPRDPGRAGGPARSTQVGIRTFHDEPRGSRS